MKRASSILLSLLLVVGTAACGSDDDGDDTGATTTEAAAGAETTAGGDTDATGGGSVDVDAIENPEVAEYCRQVEAFIEEYADVLADPAADAARAMEMLEPAQALLDVATSLDPSELSQDDVAALNACSEQLSDAQSQG